MLEATSYHQLEESQQADDTLVLKEASMVTKGHPLGARRLAAAASSADTARIRVRPGGSMPAPLRPAPPARPLQR